MNFKIKLCIQTLKEFNKNINVNNKSILFKSYNSISSLKMHIKQIYITRTCKLEIKFYQLYFKNHSVMLQDKTGKPFHKKYPFHINVTRVRWEELIF